MDLHLSTDKVVSLRDAVLRYAVIVAGILTALGLNQWVESRQHARQGREALASIEAELLRNKVVLGRSLEALQGQRENFLAAEKLLGEKTFDVPDLQSRARLLLAEQNTIDLNFGLNLSALQHSAWDAAVASQSVQYLPLERRVDLARAYALIGEVAVMARSLTTSDALLARAASADMFLRGESKDALQLARAIRDQGTSIMILSQAYRNLQQRIGSTLGDPSAPSEEPAAMPASAPSSAALPR